MPCRAASRRSPGTRDRFSGLRHERQKRSALRFRLSATETDEGDLPGDGNRAICIDGAACGGERDMNARAQVLVEHLPDLRRYAAALVGASRGDRLVEACVEQVLEDPGLLDPVAPRHALLRLFDQIFERAAAPQDLEAVVGTEGLRSAVAQLPTLDRKILLLSNLMRLSRGEVAAVLGLTQSEIADRLLAARETLRRHLAARVLVIEDEPIVALSIARIISRMGHSVCGVAHDRREALERVREGKPTLILADVRLRGGDDGIRTVEEIIGRTPMPVIFITGYAHDLIQNQRMRPTLVIGKPFMPQTLEVAVQRVLSQRALAS
jgi:CheY-like chemotaxis protein